MAEADKAIAGRIGRYGGYDHATFREAYLHRDDRNYVLAILMSIHARQAVTAVLRGDKGWQTLSWVYFLAMERELNAKTGGQEGMSAEAIQKLLSRFPK